MLGRCFIIVVCVLYCRMDGVGSLFYNSGLCIIL